MSHVSRRKGSHNIFREKQALWKGEYPKMLIIIGDNIYKSHSTILFKDAEKKA